MRKNKLLILPFLFCLVLTGCASDDSDTPPPTAKTDPNKVQNPSNENSRSSLAEKSIVRSNPKSGWVWYLSGVDDASPNSFGSKLRCLLKDSSNAEVTNAMIVAIGGGAVLGMAIQLTHPKKPEDDVKDKSPNNAFWNFFYWTRGQLNHPVRSAIVAGSCQAALGGYPIPAFAGLLGNDSMVGSAALIISGGSMALAAPFIRNSFSRKMEDVMNQNAGPEAPPQSPRELADRIRRWAEAKGPSRIFKYELTPALTLLTFGFGVYWLVDTSLQHGQFGSDSADCN